MDKRWLIAPLVELGPELWTASAQTA